MTQESSLCGSKDSVTGARFLLCSDPFWQVHYLQDSRVRMGSVSATASGLHLW